MAIPFSHGAVVVTTISPGNEILQALAEGCARAGAKFIVVGDRKSPPRFRVSPCDYHDVAAQQALSFRYAALCPENSYARKNLGYLLAMAGGAEFIVETDDDNLPQPAFWQDRGISVTGAVVARAGWTNAYAHFTDRFIYPRGFPLHLARERPATAGSTSEVHSPIQQALADENPDVDAIYRMLFPLPLTFRNNAPLLLGPSAWCPFNSQNTTFFREVFPLLYLPAFCSFRMTDIWRGLVAQRILWTCGGALSFHAATVVQRRNHHDLPADFADEVPGYLNNTLIASKLEALPLAPGHAAIPDNLRACYGALVGLEILPPDELGLLDAWLADCA